MSLATTYARADDGLYYANPILRNKDHRWFICWDDDDPVELVIRDKRSVEDAQALLQANGIDARDNSMSEYSGLTRARERDTSGAAQASKSPPTQSDYPSDYDGPAAGWTDEAMAALSSEVCPTCGCHPSSIAARTNCPDCPSARSKGVL